MSQAAETATTGLAMLRAGRAAAECVLVDRSGSSPFAIGATMVVLDDGSMEGSVTAGCVEGAVATEAIELLHGRAGARLRLVTYGISDELAGEVGLSCGGVVEIAISELKGEAASAWLEARASDRPAGCAIVLEGPLAGARVAVIDGLRVGSLGGTPAFNESVVRDINAAIATGGSRVRGYRADGSPDPAATRVFIAIQSHSARLVIVGASDYAGALASAASLAGYDLTICEPRAAFASSFHATVRAEIVHEHPAKVIASFQLEPRDAVVVLTHDPKFDEPAIRAALDSGAGYVGALGSRRTVADRRRRLLAAGVDPGDLNRLFSPCGLDLGAGTPEETAISVIAELLAVRSGRAGGHLSRSDLPIHPR